MDLVIATALATFGITFGVGYGVYRLFARHNPVLQRLHRYVEEDYSRREKEGSTLPGAKLRPTMVRVLERISKSRPLSEEKLRGLKLQLLQAGVLRNDAVNVFVGAQVALSLFLGLAGMGVAAAARKPAAMSLLIICMFAMMGYTLPQLWLRSQINRRKKAIVRGLPDALDLMVVCVEAGLGLNAALLRVGEELKRHCPVVSDEFLMVTKEMRAGISRQDALRHLAERNPVEDIQSFVAILIQTDRLGSSMAKTLRAQSDSLRTRRRQRAEEAAAKTSIKLLFPLVFFILPALFVVLLGPGLLQVIKVFSSSGMR
ncbi:MAG: type II secretion system F family protein [candidate division KSB1 bacterium]|nr:type II secretion system F family protein [candidate division KSB1 bacterium]